MSELRVIETRPEAARKDVIEVLEEALERARRGEILAIAIAEVNSDRATSHSWSKSDVFSSLAGAIARLQHRFQVMGDNA